MNVCQSNFIKVLFHFNRDFVLSLIAWNIHQGYLEIDLLDEAGIISLVVDEETE